MKNSRRFFAALFFTLLIFPALLQNGRIRAEEKTESMLPAADLYKPDEIKAGFDRQQITPFGDPKFYFEVVVPKDWDSRPIEITKEDFAEAEAGKAMSAMALFTPNSGNGQKAVINIHSMRVPTRVQLTDWMDIVLKKMGDKVLARQRGEFNGRAVEDALLQRDVEGPVLTRFTASRHGDYIFIVSGSATEEQYPKYKRIFGLAAVTFDPLGISVNTPFKITDFKFLESKGGPPRTQGPYNPKDTVYATFEFEGFALDQQGSPKVLFEMVAFDPEGIPLFKPIKDEIHQAVKGKNPLGYLTVDLPSFAAPGKYTVRIKAHDAVKNVDYELVEPFDIEAGPTLISNKLEFRDCRFSSSKDGPPVKPLTTRAGDKIYSSCKTAGMQFRQDRMDVRISLQVVGPHGETIFDKPDLIKLNDSYFYHPATLFVDLSAWVGLPSDAAPGKYSWIYKMTDLIANTTASYEEQFEVK